MNVFWSFWYLCIGLIFLSQRLLLRQNKFSKLLTSIYFTVFIDIQYAKRLIKNIVNRLIDNGKLFLSWKPKSNQMHKSRTTISGWYLTSGNMFQSSMQHMMSTWAHYHQESVTDDCHHLTKVKHQLSMTLQLCMITCHLHGRHHTDGRTNTTTSTGKFINRHLSV